MAGKKVTSARVARIASGVLRSSNEDKRARSTAGSALSQREKGRRK